MTGKHYLRGSDGGRHKTVQLKTAHQRGVVSALAVLARRSVQAFRFFSSTPMVGPRHQIICSEAALHLVYIHGANLSSWTIDMKLVVSNNSYRNVPSRGTATTKYAAKPGHAATRKYRGAIHPTCVRDHRVAEGLPVQPTAGKTGREKIPGEMALTPLIAMESTAQVYSKFIWPGHPMFGRP